MKFAFVILLSTLMLFVVGCTDHRVGPVIDPEPPGDTIEIVENMKFAESNVRELTTDPYTITDVQLVDPSQISFMIQHGGGCETHTYELYGEKAFAESIPVQTNLRLVHDAHGDICKALVTAEVTFDIEAIQNLYVDSYGGLDDIQLHIIDADGEQYATFLLEA